MEKNITDKKWYELFPINGDLAEALADGSKIELVRHDRNRLPHVLVRFNKERQEEGRHPEFGYFELTEGHGSTFYNATNYFCHFNTAKSLFIQSLNETRVAQLRISELNKTNKP